MIGPETDCMKCKHLHKPVDGDWGYKCAAFPAGIPEEIITGEVEHRQPYDGDNGIVFEAVE